MLLNQHSDHGPFQSLLAFGGTQTSTLHFLSVKWRYSFQGHWTFGGSKSKRENVCEGTLSIVPRGPGFHGGSVVKSLPANAESSGSTPGLGRSPWRRKWQYTPLFPPGKSHGQRSFVGYSPWGLKELGMT